MEYKVVDLKDCFRIDESLYQDDAEINNNKLILKPEKDFIGNVYLLKKKQF